MRLFLLFSVWILELFRLCGIFFFWSDFRFITSFNGNIPSPSKEMLANTERTSRKGQSSETGNTGYIRRRKNKAKTQHNMCWTKLSQANTNNVNKTCAFLQTTGGNGEPNVVFMWKS